MKIYDIYSKEEINKIGNLHKKQFPHRSDYLLGSEVAHRCLALAEARKMIKDIPLTEDQRKTLEYLLAPIGYIYDDESSKMLRRIDKAVGV